MMMVLAKRAQEHSQECSLLISQRQQAVAHHHRRPRVVIKRVAYRVLDSV